jgi:hypothetical protein
MLKQLQFLACSVLLGGVTASAPAQEYVVESNRDRVMFNFSAGNPLAALEVDTHYLRIISPTVLELVWITRDSSIWGSRIVNVGTEPNPIWEFNKPTAASFLITANGNPISIEMVGNSPEIGIKHQVLYAPIEADDLRVENVLYLKLASGIPENAIVRVTNPSGGGSEALWPGTMQFIAFGGGTDTAQRFTSIRWAICWGTRRGP